MEKIDCKRIKFALGCIALLFCGSLLGGCLAGCDILKRERVGIERPSLVKVSLGEFPEFTDDMFWEGLEPCTLQSISYFKRVPPTRVFRFGDDRFDAEHMIRSLEHFLNFIRQQPSMASIKGYIEANYWVYRSVGDVETGQVLFTGYYEPLLRGSLKKSGEYPVPIYTRPDDLITIDLSLFSHRFPQEKIIGRYTGRTVVPYYDRQEIDNGGVLDGKCRELAWVRDPVDLFFLQIQGSGKIYLNDGKLINAHYHTSNGRPYRSIGKLLIEQGKIPRSEMSMQKIRTYLQDHPEEVQTILNYNPSYVFFREEEDGPFGSLEVKLTPRRSIALDRRIFPPAAMAFIETEKPAVDADGQIYAWEDFRQFVLHQDTGGAIRGPGRADLFWGNGPYAEIAAGHMQQPGNLYFLILKPEV